MLDDQVNAVFRVDPVTGDRTIFSAAGVRGDGFGFAWPNAAAFTPDGNLLVADLYANWPNPGSGSGGIIEVDRVTGDRRLLSGGTPGVGSGPEFDIPYGIDLWGDTIYSVNAGTGNHPNGYVLRVDRKTGNRTLLTGSNLGTPTGAAFDAFGNLFVADSELNAVLRVDPTTGETTKISSAARGSGPLFEHALDLAVAPAGDIYVADLFDQAVFHVDPATGNRRIISGAGAGSGPSFGSVEHVNIGLAGELLVGDPQGTVWRVDPVTGHRTIVSGQAVGGGPAFTAVRDVIVVVPEPGLAPILALGFALYTGFRPPRRVPVRRTARGAEA